MYMNRTKAPTRPSRRMMPNARPALAPPDMPLLEAGAAVADAVPAVDVTASWFGLGTVAMVVGGGDEDEEVEDDELDVPESSVAEAVGVTAIGGRTVPVMKTAEPANVFGAVVKTMETSVTTAGSGDLASMAVVRSESTSRLKSLRKASLAWANMTAVVLCGARRSVWQLTAHRPETVKMATAEATRWTD